MLAAATLLVVLDSIAAEVDLVETAFGTGSEAGTIGKAAADKVDVLAALNDASVQGDVTPVFRKRAGLVVSSAVYGALQGPMLQRALDRHYGGNAGSLNAFLTAEDERVHPNLRLAGMQIDARNAFAPAVVDPVASYEGTGAGLGTFAAGSDIDTSLYYAAGFEVIVDAMGASDRTLTLTLRQWDGSTVQRNVVVAGSSAPGTTVAVGGAGEKFVAVTDITTTGGGGTAADRLRVRSIIERAIAL